MRIFPTFIKDDLYCVFYIGRDFIMNHLLESLKFLFISNKYIIGYFYSRFKIGFMRIREKQHVSKMFHIV